MSKRRENEKSEKFGKFSMKVLWNFMNLSLKEYQKPLKLSISSEICD